MTRAQSVKPLPSATSMHSSCLVRGPLTSALHGPAVLDVGKGRLDRTERCTHTHDVDDHGGNCIGRKSSRSSPWIGQVQFRPSVRSWLCLRLDIAKGRRGGRNAVQVLTNICNDDGIARGRIVEAGSDRGTANGYGTPFPWLNPFEHIRSSL